MDPEQDRDGQDAGLAAAVTKGISEQAMVPGAFTVEQLPGVGSLPAISPGLQRTGQRRMNRTRCAQSRESLICLVLWGPSERNIGSRPDSSGHRVERTVSPGSRQCAPHDPSTGAAIPVTGVHGGVR
jgi:hypothetical protein